MSVFEGLLSPAGPRTVARRTEQRVLIAMLVLVDALVVAGSFALAYVLRFWLPLPLFDEGMSKPEFYALVTAALVPCYLALFQIYGLYSRTNLLGGTIEYERLFNAVTTGMLLVIGISFIQPDFVVARGWLLLAWALLVTMGITSRFFVRRLVYAQRRGGRFVDRTLIVGANPEGLAVAEQLRQAHTSGAQLVGFIDDFLPIGSEPVPGVPVVGNSNAFASLIALQEIDTVIIANTTIMRERLLSVYTTLDTFQDVEVRLASGLFELLTTGVRVREEGFVPLLVLNKTRITGVHLLSKTLLDYLVAGLALLALLPFFAVLWLLIKRDSPGPVIYRRRVVGQGRREFDAFKFRTMYIDGDRLLTPEQRQELETYGKLKDDPRITKVGAFLRKYSLDELPQLLNVLRGEMSLIGPRMITMRELEKFGKWQHNLSTVKPGLTGLWQVSGRSDLSYEDRVRLDMHYIRNHTIWLDIQILFQTIPALLSGRGAY
ncbi:MAG TPA: sugar transferase [Roseiflexaceae bacterium]|nr:sugar transferase [Roseiflexaceae bacterium]